MPERRIRVLCVTPYGVAGQGGIDRLYLYLRRFEAAERGGSVAIDFFAARGGAPGSLWVLTFPWRALLFLVRLAVRRPDLVHLNFAMGGSVYRKYALLCLARLFGCRTLLHFHGQFTARELTEASLMATCFRRLCRAANGIIVLGETYRRAFIELAGIPAERLAIVPNGIPDFAEDLELPKPRRDALRLLFAGEVGERKGADILIEALGRLAAEAPAWTCVVAGNGDLAPYRALAERNGVADRVRFTGWIEAADMHRLMRESDVVVLPSRSEALPLTLIEGACAGAALVATPVGEVRDIVLPGENGLLVGEAPAELAAALRRLSERRDELARMQLASRRRYESRYHMLAFVRQLHGVYVSLLRNPAPDARPVSSPPRA